MLQCNVQVLPTWPENLAERNMSPIVIMILRKVSGTHRCIIMLAGCTAFNAADALVLSLSQNVQ